MNICPSPEELRLLQDGLLTDQPDGHRIASHVETCKDCQAVLDGLGQTEVGGFLQRLAGIPPDQNQILLESPAKIPATRPDTTYADGSHPPSIEGYDLLRELSRGGQAVVYQAVQRSTKRDVAVKVLHGGPYASKANRKRFEREVELAANLRHPHIIAIFDSGETADGHLFYAMDYVRGAAITDHVRQGNLNLKQGLTLFATVCDAVNYAHQKGVIHRDLKPSNILVDVNDSVRVLDFGLAKKVAEPFGTVVSVRGELLGTLAYMSPEQTRGDPESIDTRSDIYSLGVILYEMLTGHHPYPVTGGVPEAIRRITETIPPSPRKQWSKETGISISNQGHGGARCPIDEELETIVLKAMTKEPERRYQSAGELARDLRHYLAGEAIEAKRDSAIYVLRKLIRRHRAVVALAGFSMVLLAAFAGTMTVARQRAVREKQEAIEARKDRERALKDRERVLAELDNVLLGLATNLADPREAVLWFCRAARISQNNPQREQLHRSRVRTWSRQMPLPLCALPHDNTAVIDMSFDSTGRYILTQTANGAWTVWDWRRELQFKLPISVTSASAAAWHPELPRLAVGYADKVVVYSLPEFQLLFDKDHPADIRRVAFSPNGRLLAVGGTTVRVWDLEVNDALPADFTHESPAWALSFNCFGNRLVVATEDQLAHMLSVEVSSPELRKLFAVPHLRLEDETHGLKPMPPIFIDGGWRLLTRTENNKGYFACFDVDSDDRNDIVPFQPVPRVLAASGDQVQFVVGGTGEAHVWRGEGTRRSPRIFRHAGIEVNHAAFSPDGERIVTASSDGRARIWWIRSERVIGFPIIHQTGVRHSTFSPDGQFVATAQDDGLVRVWDPSPNDPSSYQLELDGEWSRAKISRDGRYVVPSGGSYRECSVRSTRVVDLESGNPVGPKIEVDQIITDADFLPDRRRVVIGTSRGELRLWDGDVERMTAKFKLESAIQSIAVSPDGHWVAVLGADGKVHALKGNTLEPRHSMVYSAGPLPNNDPFTNGTVAFSPQGHTIVAWGANDGSIVVWDVASGAERYRLAHDRKCLRVDFTPDGRWLATAGLDHTARVFDLETGKEAIAKLPHPDPVFRAMFSPDGSLLLTASRDHTARIWDWRQRELLTTMRHADDVHDAVFAGPHRVITASRDHSARVWDVNTGTPLTPAIPVDGGLDISGSSDGRFAVIGGPGANLRVLRVGTLFQPDAWPLEDMELRAELLAGLRIGQGNNLLPLTTNEWIERWRRLRGKYTELAR